MRELLKTLTSLFTDSLLKSVIFLKMIVIFMSIFILFHLVLEQFSLMLKNLNFIQTLFYFWASYFKVFIYSLNLWTIRAIFCVFFISFLSTVHEKYYIFVHTRCFFTNSLKVRGVQKPLILFFFVVIVFTFFFLVKLVLSYSNIHAEKCLIQYN